MALFTILEPPDGRPEKVAVIKEGFSIPAMIFSALWALAHRMWIVAILLFTVTIVLQLCVSVFEFDGILVLCADLAVALLFGFEARALQILSLKRAGFSIAELVSADNEKSAELQYFLNRPNNVERNLAKSNKTILPVTSEHHDALGLFGSH